MSTLTQRIPNFLGGISQQPDTLKLPGQVTDATNVFPDYALGMLKRPGGKFVANLKNASTGGRWFSILRDEQEKYVAQYADNTFRIWSLIDGSPRVVNMGNNTGVPVGCDLVDLQTELTDYNTAVDTVETELADLNTAGATFAETDDGQVGVESSLFEITTTYDQRYAQTVKSGVKYDGSQYTVLDNGTVIGTYTTTTFASGYELGVERTDDYPLFKQQGIQIFEVISTAAATHTAAQLTTATNALTTAESDYTTAASNANTAESAYDTEVTNCDITLTPTNGYLTKVVDGSTVPVDADDIELLTINDYTFVLNKAKVTAMDTTTTAALPNQAFVVINVVAYNAHYTVKLQGTDYTYTTPQNTSSGHVDTGDIVDNLVTAINNATGTHGVTASAAGPGIYLSSNSAFTISTSGSQTEEGIYAFQDQINIAGRLPNQCRNGYKVKVYNSDDIDADDMWVEFHTTDNATIGPGIWEETNAPEIEFQYDPLTMPHILVRLTDGSFYFGPPDGSTVGGVELPDWGDRLVGDDTTNPLPSFIGHKINNVFFHRNRLGFVSGENVIMSVAGDYFNFFAGSAQIVAADDPIDITTTSQQPVNLQYVQPVSAGLVLFGQNEQFLLGATEDIFSPSTALLTTLSKYECDQEVAAVSLGTTLAFISKTLLWTRVFELGNIRKDAPADSYEVSNNVAELIPADVDNFISSPALSMLSLGETGSNTLYQYRFYRVNNQLRAQTWYKWTLTGKLLDQFFDETTFYAVCHDDTNVFIQSYDLTQASEEGFLTLPSGEKTDVCLDMFSVNPRRTYDSSTEKTRIWLPYDNITGTTPAIVLLGGYIGQTVSATESIGGVLTGSEITVDSTGGNDYYEIDGDYRGRNLIIGYIYNMNLQLPKFYFGQQNDQQFVTDAAADLIIHRIRVNTGLSGPVTYKVDITGIGEWENVVNVTLPNAYILGNVNLSASSEHVVPVFQRNKNLKITLVGDTPFPVSLTNMSWEGNYNTKFYRRV